MPMSSSFIYFLFFCVGHVASFPFFFFFFPRRCFFFFFFFWFLALWVGMLPFFFPLGCGIDSCYVFLLLFFFILGLTIHDFFLGHDFYFLINWVIASSFYYFFFIFFCGYLSLFCINWPSFFNNGVWVNLYKVQTHFFHPSTFPLPTKQKGKKLKSSLSSDFFILPPFSIIQLFHPSNQVDLKSIPSWS